jgi:catechol 2,3-dioxygenase-like lactoylglutathione lyase family enzyme
MTGERTKAFHVSLNVTNLEASIGFYESLFGLAPAKRRPDYAKFELDDPPLVLSLEPARRVSGSSLNHMGLRVSDTETLVEVQRRLEACGIPTRRENGVSCCYAKQTKFWVRDPDGRDWEVYRLEEDLEHRASIDLASIAGRARYAQRIGWSRLATLWARWRRGTRQRLVQP